MIQDNIPNENIPNETNIERNISYNTDIVKSNKHRRNSMLIGQIKQSNEENVSDNIRIAKNYSKIIHVLVIISKLIIIASGLISFSGTRFSHWSISFSSGSLNFLATSILSYTAFLTAERKRITKSLNTKLVALGIEEKLLISENDSDKSS